MDFVIDNNKDKECEALSSLFNEITNEMKNNLPNLEELTSRAGKLHSSLKHTISALSSFLDIFERIAENASNTTGATSDIGSCLNRILLKQRTLESRMKIIAGSLIDCLMNPLQGKADEWKKNLNAIEKEHLKVNKKNQRHIKKKSEQVLRLKKKLKKEKYADPSLKRLLDDSLRDLNVHFINYSKMERVSVQKALTEHTGRLRCLITFVRPILREEMVIAGDFIGLDEILKEADSSSSGGSDETLIDGLMRESLRNNDAEDHYSLHLPTPPSSPRASINLLSKPNTRSYLTRNKMGRRPNGTPFIERRQLNGNLYSVANCDPQFRNRPNSSISLHESSSHSSLREYNMRPWSTAFWNFNQEYRSQFATSGVLRTSEESEVYIQDSEDESTISADTFSTVKRTCNPLYRSSNTSPFVKSVSIPRRCSSADRSLPPLHLNRQFIPCLSIEKHCASGSKSSPPHYDTPKPMNDTLQHVPNFNSNKGDMIIPHPIYLNSKSSMKNNDIPGNKSSSSDHPRHYSQPFINHEEGNLPKTTTSEQKPLLRGQSTPPSTEEGSSNSSDSFYSSSGYGSQFAINGQYKNEGHSHPNSNRHFTILNDKLYTSSNLMRRSLNLKLRHSPSKDGMNNQLAMMKKQKPLPPVRGSSMTSQQSETYTLPANPEQTPPSPEGQKNIRINPSNSRKKSLRGSMNEDEDNINNSSLFCAFNSKN